jgi:hypothetical protein
MKKYLILLPAILYSFIAVGQASSKTLEGSLSGGKLILNKKEISADWKLLTVIAAIGKASRDNNGPANKVHLYDNSGIVLYEAKRNGKLTGVISEVDIYFSIKESNPLIPYNLYQGNFEIENIKISKNSKPMDIDKTLGNMGYKKKGAGYWYTKNGVYIIFRFADNGLLQSLSIGKNK